MGRAVIHRRRFVAILALAAAGAGLPWRSRKANARLDWFYVAGVRFNQVHRLPKVNERVHLCRNSWQGCICYEVLTGDCERMGYIPRRYLSNIQSAEQQEWYVSAVNRRGVPWKRYKIARCIDA